MQRCRAKLISQRFTTEEAAGDLGARSRGWCALLLPIILLHLAKVNVTKFKWAKHLTGAVFGKGLGTSPEGGSYRKEKAQLGLQAQQLERMRNAGVGDTEDTLLRISSIDNINSQGHAGPAEGCAAGALQSH